MTNRGFDLIRKHAIAKTGQGALYGEGMVISYCAEPTVGIRRADGSVFDWRADMCTFGEEEEMPYQDITRQGEPITDSYLYRLSLAAHDLRNPIWRINRELWHRLKFYKDKTGTFLHQPNADLRDTPQTFYGLPYQLTDEDVFGIFEKQEAQAVAQLLATDTFFVPPSPFTDETVHAEIQQLLDLIYAMLACGCDFETLKMRLLAL